MARGGVLVLVLMAILCGPAEATNIARDGSTVTFAGSPGKGPKLAVFVRGVTRGQDVLQVDVYARVISSNGRPSGSEVRVGEDVALGPWTTGDPIAAAYDTRRRRWLVAWSGRTPAMAQMPCPGSPPTSPCRQAKREIFVRAINASGRPAGRARKVTSTGAPADVSASAAVPGIAYERRTDRFLLVGMDVRGLTGTVFAQVLAPDGTAASAQRSLADATGGPTPSTELRLLESPSGGALLIYGRGDDEVRARPLDATGRARGETSLVSAPGGANAFGVQAATGPDRVLVVFGEAGSGASRGIKARLLSYEGHPVAEAIGLPFVLGTGRVTVTSFGTGWIYGHIDERADLATGFLVRRADLAGRPIGNDRLITADDALEPAVTDAGDGTILAAWTYRPVARGGTAAFGPQKMRPRVVRIRP